MPLNPLAVAVAQGLRDLPKEGRLQPLSLLREVDLSCLGDAPPAAPTFVLDGLIPDGEVTLLAGHGGVGKSSLALSMAAHLACGRPWAGLRCRPSKVLFMSMEDSTGVLKHRLHQIAIHSGLDLTTLRSNLQVIDAADAPPLATEVFSAGHRCLSETDSMAELRSLAADRDVVFIDNASDAFEADENVRRMVRAFIRLLKPVAGAVVLLAHISKDAAATRPRKGAAPPSEDYSGSSAWHNSVRSRISLTPNTYGAVTLRHAKSNYGALVADLHFRVGPGGVPIHDQGAVPPPPIAARSSKEQQDAIVLAALLKAAGRGTHITSASSGQNPAAKVIEELLADSAKLDRKAINAALTRLEQSGRIERTTARNEKTRKVREVWVPAPNALNAPNAELSTISALSPDGQQAPRAECAEQAVGVVGGFDAHIQRGDSAHTTGVSVTGAQTADQGEQADPTLAENTLTAGYGKCRTGSAADRDPAPTQGAHP